MWWYITTINIEVYFRVKGQVFLFTEEYETKGVMCSIGITDKIAHRKVYCKDVYFGFRYLL